MTSQGDGGVVIRGERVGDDYEITLAGEFDYAGIDDVDREIERAQGSDAQTVVIDLSGLHFMDSSGLHVLLKADAHSRRDGHRLTLIRGPRNVHRLFVLAGVADQLPFSD